MCTIAILFQTVDGAPLVIAANRDEMFARPTRPPERLAPGLVGGVDVLSGGTWLAVRRDGRFAAVTNQRVMAPPPSGLRSRGLVVRDLALSDDPAGFVAELDPTHYASMNLTWGDASGVSIAYLRREGDKAIEVLPPGNYVLCNDRLGSRGFPRGVRLAGAIAAMPLRWPDMQPGLCATLADHTHDDPEPSHLPPDVAGALTATCIHTPAYGTRSSTVLAIRPGETFGYMHADGPPCVTPFTDRLGLLAAA